MPAKKKNLDAPLTLRDFQEFVDFTVKTFATKYEMEKIKNELKNEIATIKYDIIAIKNEITAIKYKLESTTDEILTSNDKLIHKLDTHNTERLMIIAGMDRHERRITQLEKHAGLVK